MALENSEFKKRGQQVPVLIWKSPAVLRITRPREQDSDFLLKSAGEETKTAPAFPSEGVFRKKRSLSSHNKLCCALKKHLKMAGLKLKDHVGLCTGQPASALHAGTWLFSDRWTLSPVVTQDQSSHMAMENKTRAVLLCATAVLHWNPMLYMQSRGSCPEETAPSPLCHDQH